MSYKNIVTLFCDSDSQIFGALPHGEAFQQKGWRVRFVLDNMETMPDEVLQKVNEHFDVVNTTFVQFLQEKFVKDSDVVGVFSYGSRIHNFRNQFEATCQYYGERRPGIFTGFNGLVYEKFEEGLSWRLGYDVISVNGQRDLTLLKEFLRNTEYENQPVVVTGLKRTNGLYKNLICRNRSRKKFVFAEQVVVPKSLNDRQRLIAILVGTAKKNPDWDVVIKKRIKRGEKTFHSEMFDIVEILSGISDKPSNISISSEPIDKLLMHTDLFCTISSTAIFESIAIGVPSFVMSDFGIKNQFGTHVFFSSKLIVALEGIRNLDSLLSLRPDTRWLDWVGLTHCNPEVLVDYFNGRRYHPREFQKKISGMVNPQNKHLVETDIANFIGLEKKLNNQDSRLRAVESLRNAIETKPDSTHLRRLLAEVYMSVGDRRRACEELRICRKLKPGNKNIRRREQAFRLGSLKLANLISRPFSLR